MKRQSRILLTAGCLCFMTAAAVFGWTSWNAKKNQEQKETLLAAMDSLNTESSQGLSGLPSWQIDGISLCGKMILETGTVYPMAWEKSMEGWIQVQESDERLVLKTTEDLSLTQNSRLELQNLLGQYEIYEVIGSEKCSEEDWKWLSQESWDLMVVSQSQSTWAYLCKKA